MLPHIDDLFEPDSRTGRALPRVAPSHHDLPVYRPKRQMHPMIFAAVMFLTGGAAFYGAEMFAPVEWKPSHIQANFDEVITEARKAGELKAQIRYEAKLKQIETAAVQWQEQYKAAAGGIGRNYDAAYSQAGIFAGALADIQKQYTGTRYQLAASSVGGEIQAANTATLIGALGGIFDRAIETSANDYADRMRKRAYTKLDEAARGGVTVTVEGWKTRLPAPDSVARELRDLPPLRLPGIDATGADAIDPALRAK